MNWGALDGRDLGPRAERGRPVQRLVRGLLWAVLLLFVMSILLFSMSIFGPPPVTTF